MEFLRRLHPSHAAAPGAARLDAVPRWIERAPPRVDAARPVPMLGMPVPPGAQATPAQVSEPSNHAEAARPAIARPEPRPADRLRGAPRAARERTPGTPLHAQLSRAPATLAPTRPLDALPLSSVAAIASDPKSGAAPAATPSARAMPPTAAELGVATPPTPGRPAAQQTLPARPLRAVALADRPAPRDAEPTIVHVTIDRIDVRLPAAAAAPAARERRPRAASAVAPLSDYLRGPPRGGHG